MDPKQLENLFELAALYNIETESFITWDIKQDPADLLFALKAIGAPADNLKEIFNALRYRKQELLCNICEPVIAVWEGMDAEIKLVLPDNLSSGLAKLSLQLENGELLGWSYRLEEIPVTRKLELDHKYYNEKIIIIPASLPPGYHRCTLELPNGIAEQVLIIAAPDRAYLPAEFHSANLWGTFIPLYALRSQTSPAAGDLSDLEALLNWTGALGGNFIGTLPLLAAFLDKPFEPSPYSPASRLFWNEFYLDLNRIPEYDCCTPAREISASGAYQKISSALRETSLVDYRRGMAQKRCILELLSHCLGDFENRRDRLNRWVEDNPEALRYARFRAAVEHRRAVWQHWPEHMRQGHLEPEDYNPAAVQYHLYVQWLMENQLGSIAANAAQKNSGLYLDLPLGVHPSGYDVWSRQNLFALKASCGAPPDTMNSEGQNWSFPPLHPEQIRRQGYSYFIDVLRHNMKHAKILRVDHVMGFHRLFWIPEGLTAKNGVYVKYRAQEFYAVIALEAHRQKTVLVGEDLGIVPGVVREDMKKRNLLRMYVLPFELKNRSGRIIEPNPVPESALACLNTHDMQPFAAYWKSLASGDRRALNHYLTRRKSRAKRNNAAAGLNNSLDYLAASRARIMLINLEDLWLEKLPQNIPGTHREYPNWRRKARKDLEQITGSARIRKTLLRIKKLRKNVR